MRIKLDENLPLSIVPVLRNADHDVDTVGDEGLDGASDRGVLDAATAADRLVVTLDRGFGDIRRYPPGTHGGVLVIRPHGQGPAAVGNAVLALVRRVDIESLVGCVATWHDRRLRVRRPSNNRKEP